MDFGIIGQEVGKLVADKQKAYGDSFGRSGECLRQMFPDGIEPHQYDDLLTIARILDKLFRLASDPTYGDESPWRDICGYSLLSMGKDPRETDNSCPPQERIDEVAKAPVREHIDGVTKKLSDNESWEHAHHSRKQL